jgi:hypothetical protein
MDKVKISTGGPFGQVAGAVLPKCASEWSDNDWTISGASLLFEPEEFQDTLEAAGFEVQRLRSFGLTLAIGNG